MGDKLKNLMRPWVASEPLALPLGQWEVLNKSNKEKYPIRWFLSETIGDLLSSISNTISQAKWKLYHRYYPKHRYDLIRTNLPFGYHDPDTQILHGNMELLCKFYIGTKDEIAWDTTSHASAFKTIESIYFWWTDVYPNRANSIEPFPDIDFSKLMARDDSSEDPEIIEWERIAAIHRQAEIDWEIEDGIMLKRLVDIRSYLWYP